VREGDDGEHDEDGDGHDAAQGADVVEPLPGVHSDDVHEGDEGEPGEGEDEEVAGVGGEVRAVGAEGEEDGACSEVEDGGKVGQVGHHVCPGGDEAGEISVGFAGPDVEAAFGGVSRGELEDGGGERDEESEEGEEPDGDGAGSGCGCGGDPADGESADDVEEGEVAEGESALKGEGRRIGGVARAGRRGGH